MPHPTREAARKLASLARDQGGYFTAKQAGAAGYAYPQLAYHVSAGNFERVDHGLYRLPTVPHDDHDEFIRLSLWSRDREDEPQAAVSHESALVLHDLSELLPSAIHLTVPPRFRKARPEGCVLHKTSLSDEDVEERAGFRVTTPLRTIVDAAGGGVAQEQLGKAVDEALSRGLVRKTWLEAAAKHSDRLSLALRRTKAANRLPRTSTSDISCDAARGMHASLAS